jgi:hypothetical protein
VWIAVRPSRVQSQPRERPFPVPDFSPAPYRRCVTSRAAAFLQNSAADSSEQIGPNLDETTTRQRLKGVKSPSGPSTCGKSAIGGSGRKSSVVPLRISRATGPRTGTICSRAVGGVALLGATCSWVRGIGLLSRRVAGGIALLGECERGGSKRDSDHEAQSFHVGHFAFSYLPTTRLTPADERSFICQKRKASAPPGSAFAPFAEMAILLPSTDCRHARRIARSDDSG